MGFNFSPNDTSTLIGAGAAILGVCIGLAGRYILSSWDQQEIINGVLQAINVELKEIYRQLNSSSMKKAWKEFEEIEKGDERKYFRMIFPVSQDYLTIYRSNANLIGQIKNSDLRQKIVRDYTSLHMLLEMYKLNNRILIQYREVRNKGQSGLANELRLQLQGIAPALKSNQNSLNEKLTEDLFKILEREISQRQPYPLHGFTKDSK